MAAAQARLRTTRRFTTTASRSTAISCSQDVEVALPNGRVLLDDVDLAIEPGSDW